MTERTNERINFYREHNQHNTHKMYRFHGEKVKYWIGERNIILSKFEIPFEEQHIWEAASHPCTLSEWLATLFDIIKCICECHSTLLISEHIIRHILAQVTITFYTQSIIWIVSLEWNYSYCCCYYYYYHHRHKQSVCVLCVSIMGGAVM